MLRELISLALAAGIATATYCFVWYVLSIQNKPRPKIDKSVWPLILLTILFIASRYLPEFADFFNNRTTVQHAVGGGFVSALSFWYIRRHVGKSWPLPLDLILLFAVVSALGAANEIIEASATWSGLYTVDGRDVWQDIFANSIGALVGYTILKVTQSLVK